MPRLARIPRYLAALVVVTLGVLLVHPLPASAASPPAGVLFNGPAVAVQPLTSRIDMFVVAADGGLHQRTRSLSGWSAWSSLGGVLGSSPSAVWTDSGATLHVFAKGPDGSLYQRYWNSSGWAPWASFPPPPSGIHDSPSVSATVGGGRLDVFVTGGNGHLYQKTWTPAGWSGWIDLQGWLKTAPAVSWSANGSRLDVAGIGGGDGRLYMRTWTSAGWANWTSVAPPTSYISAPAIAKSGDGSRMDVFVTGGNGNVYQATASGASLGSWIDFGGVFHSRPAAAWNTEGTKLDLLGVGADYQVHNKTWTSTGWTAWNGLAAPGVGLRPIFQLPFVCGDSWQLGTYRGHGDFDIDMRPNSGSAWGRPIRASFNGKVIAAGIDGELGDRTPSNPNGPMGTGGGYFVKIDHGGGWRTLYLHMLEPPMVSVNQVIQQGHQLGKVGSTGESSGPHLHYEQQRNGAKVQSWFDNVPSGITTDGVPAGEPLSPPVNRVSNNCT